jgi:type IV pilus assembly protein PilY1
MSTIRTHARRSLAVLLVAIQALQPAIAQTTVDLAQAPLASRTQATPNLIFGIDDSGSTDFEVLLPSNDGSLWFNRSDRTFWNGTGAAWQFNINLTNSGHDKYAYLFPNGESDNWNDDRRTLDDASGHYAIPPTVQFAHLRSAAFNPLYYDPAIRYAPWPPGHITRNVDGSTVGGTNGLALSFSNASSTAARSHPYYPTSARTSITPTTFDLTQNVNVHAPNWIFGFPPGTTIPGDASARRFCTNWNGGTPSRPATSSGAFETTGWVDVTADYTVRNNTGDREYCFASLSYYPATYWVPDASCTSGAGCTTAPNGTRLRRIEIRSSTASYTKAAARTDCAGSSCTYGEEMQNFANWFQFFRKRRLTMAAGMGQALTNVRGVRAGTTFFNRSAGSDVTMFDMSATNNHQNGRMVIGRMYTADANGGTPTRRTLRNIYNQYIRTDANAPIQFGCQRNNAFIVTDGYNSDTGSFTPSYDRSTWVGTAPYTTIHTDSLADIAGALYTNNPRPDLPTGLLAVDPTFSGLNPDRNTNLHVNTHAITVGAIGEIYGRAVPQFTNPFLNPPVWPTPQQYRPSQVDDLWHAAINGRGQMFTARNANELTASLNTVVRNMLVAAGSDAGVAVSSVNLRAGDNTAYVSSYNAQDWSGQLCAYPIDLTTGNVDTSPGRETWCVREQLNTRGPDDRLIASHNGTSAVRFTTGASGLTTAQVTGLATDVGSTDGADVLAWLRGNRTNEGVTYRTRSSLLGDITTGEPVYDRPSSGNPVVYQGANDGMLHAFDATTGAELWAYVPYNVLGNLRELARPTYTHRYYVDGTPEIQDIGNRRILVGGLRGGGAGFFAIDVTDPRPANEAQLVEKVLWEFPNASTPAALRNQIGTSYGKPQIVKLADGTWVALLTSGYNNASGQNHLHVINLVTGALIRTITTASGSGLTQVSAWVTNPETNPTVDYVYGGDLAGNLWRFDLTGSSTSWASRRLAALAGPTGSVQPITTAPELGMVGSRRLVTVGTGRLLGAGDMTSNEVQSVYGIVDNLSTTPEVSTPRTNLFRQTLTTQAGGVRRLTSSNIDWATFRGWYFDLPTGERVSTDPSIAFGILSLTSNKPSAQACASESFIYAVSLDNGGELPAANFLPGQPWAGRQIGYTYASRPVIVSLPNGKVVAITHKSDAAVASSDLPVSNATRTRRIAWREVQR